MPTPDTAAFKEPPPVDPAEIAAMAMVEQVLAARPDLQAAAATRGVAVVVEVPDAGWCVPIKEALLIQLGQAGTAVEPDVDEFDLEPAVQPSWVSCSSTGHGRTTTRASDADIAHWLASGRSVLGVSPCPRRQLPKDLLRAADCVVVIPSMDRALLADVVETITGERPTISLPELYCRLVGTEELRLARRPGETANAMMERLNHLVASKVVETCITLDDLHGMEVAVNWGKALATDIKDFAAGHLPWAAVDKGILLAGPPGTGKTTFAQALAGTCGIPLIAGSLAQWQAEGHLGDLLKAMRSTFDEARRAAPAILFVDEVDSFGDRSSFSHDHKNYSTQVVNGFLEELDGVTGREGVVVVGACNLPERLDPAIIRSGRLDRVVEIPLPDQPSLAGIFRYWLGGDVPDADLSMVATLALGSTGADVERWVRCARRRARGAGRAIVLNDLVAEIRGPDTGIPMGVLRQRAIHEAGHAIALVTLRPGYLLGATIRRTQDFGGGVFASPRDDQPVREDLLKEIRILLAGRAAEDVVLGEVSVGAGGDERCDLARATLLAVRMLSSFAMGDGSRPLWLGYPRDEEVGTFLRWRPDIERSVTAMLESAYADIVTILTDHRRQLERIADLLVARETISGAEVEAEVRGRAKRLRGSRRGNS
ncbi:MAG: AAA family ATPase [Magnetospirillum sp.]|nr:AAA family ATPase [Magnetospirillum sp.]